MFNFNTFILTHVVGYLNQQTPYAYEERSWTQFLRIAASLLHRIIYRLRMILHKINGKNFVLAIDEAYFHRDKVISSMWLA